MFLFGWSEDLTLSYGEVDTTDKRRLRGDMSPDQISEGTSTWGREQTCPGHFHREEPV